MSSKRGWASCPDSSKSLHISKRTKAKPSNVPIVNTEEPDQRFVTDHNNLLEIFPPEVWLLIFGKVESSSVLEKVTNSSLTFRAQLLPQRATFLFESVWKVVGPQVEKNVDKGGNMFCDLPLLEPYECELAEKMYTEAKREFLKLRLVCKSWNTGFDNFYEQHPTHFTLQKEGSSCPDIIRRIMGCYHEETPIEPYAVHSFFKKFDPDYRTTSRNPFLGRSITIHISEEENFVFYAKLMNILLEYGHHIWYCTINVRDSFSSRSVWYTILACLVERMPNLKVFYLAYWMHVSIRDTCESREQLQSAVHSLPLPTLEKLQVLKTAWVPTPVFLELVRTNGHVHTLDIHRCNASLQMYDYFCSGVLPMLKTFSISSYSDLDFLQIFNDQAQWPLTKLLLNLSRIPSIEWHKVFGVLQSKFGNTLTYLDIQLPHSPTRDFRRGQILSKTDLRFPQLTCLNLCMPDVECLGFLLPSCNLSFDQNLYIRSLSYEYASGWELRESEVVVSEKTKNQLFSAMHVLKLNLWTDLPKLKMYNFYFDRDPRISSSLKCSDGWCFRRREWEGQVQSA